jgi:hypothetical protein
MEYINGPMGGSIGEILRRMLDREKDNYYGLMVRSMMENGLMESSMARVCLLCLIRLVDWLCGKMEKRLLFILLSYFIYILYY